MTHTNLRRRIAVLLFATMVVPLALTSFALPAAATTDEYCRQNPNDPRCKPDYCQVNPNDPWCWDPNYCERNPTDPICKKDPTPQEPKEVCQWWMDAAPPVAGASPGPAVLTLKCPNHILSDWSCGWKDGRSLLPVPDPTPSTPMCTFVKTDADPTDPCARSWTWSVARPDFRTVTAWVRAEMWKDADCDGKPDDWNTGYEGKGCALPNEYGPKVRNSTAGGYTPMPDGHVNDCDKQNYEFQWRQFN